MDVIAAILIKYNIQFETTKKDFKFLCPFHNDRNPSMHMNQMTGQYYCFSCKTGGGSIEHFIKRLTGKTEDIEKLISDKDRIKMKLQRKYKESAERINVYDDLVAFDLALKEELENFIPAHESSVAMEYLSGRKFEEKTVKHFKLMYATQGYYENRIVMPFYRDGRMIGFNSRLIGAQKHTEAKRYLFFVYRPEMAGFLYNADSVKTSYCILVEGVFDLMWMWQCRYTNVVSPLSTGVSLDHIDSLSRYRKIIFCFDNDENQAGQKAVLKAAKDILKILPDKEIFSVSLPPGKDANECSVEELVLSMQVIDRVTIKEKQKELHKSFQ